MIDFAQKTLEQALGWPAALQLVRDRVRPFRETVRREGHRSRWWQFGEPRVGMRSALAGRGRFVVMVAHAKRLAMSWSEPWTLASNAVMVVSVDDDYSMGVLLSRAHGAWAWARSSTLKGDLRYTPSTAFMTFPFPDPWRRTHARR